MFWLFLPAGFTIFYIIQHLMFKIHIDISYILINRWLDKHQSNVNTLRNWGVLGPLFFIIFSYILLPIVFTMLFLLIIPLLCVVIYFGPIGFVALFTYILKEINIESSFYVLIFNLGVILSVGILIHKYVSNYKGSISWKACFFPVLLFFVLSLLSYYVRIGSESKSWFCWPFEFYHNKKDIWEFLTPHITGAVGFVTFWAFWAQLKANELASDDAKRTGIQDTFNSMMETYNRNLLNLKYKDKNGLDAIDEYILIINDLIETNDISEAKFYLIYSYFYFIRKEEDLSRLDKTFFHGYYNPELREIKYEHRDIKRSNHSALSTYYYQLFRIVKYIVVDNKDFLDDDEKKKYIGILRSQMSPNEQLLLFYNWLAGDQMNDKKSGPQNQFGYSWEDKDNAFFSEHKIIDHLNTLALSTKFEKEYKEEFKSIDD